MDGRVQLPVINFLMEHCKVDYVDSITEAGPVKILYEKSNMGLLESIFGRIDVSLKKHDSCCIAIAAHHDCAGNPVDKAAQLDQLAAAVDLIKKEYPDAKVLGLWVDETWAVSIVCQ
jgi:hypothetical protein